MQTRDEARAAVATINPADTWPVDAGYTATQCRNEAAASTPDDPYPTHGMLWSRIAAHLETESHRATFTRNPHRAAMIAATEIAGLWRLAASPNQDGPAPYPVRTYAPKHRDEIEKARSYRLTGQPD